MRLDTGRDGGLGHVRPACRLALLASVRTQRDGLRSSNSREAEKEKGPPLGTHFRLMARPDGLEPPTGLLKPMR